MGQRPGAGSVQEIRELKKTDYEKQGKLKGNHSEGLKHNRLS